VYLDETDIDVVQKLYRHHFIGGKHTETRNITKEFDKRHADMVEKSIKKLISLNLVIAKKSTGQLHVSLNPRRIGEIKRIIGE
jgi:predicted transcriptional regulator